MIELQWHSVAGDNFHTLLRVTPNNQALYKKDKRFVLKDGNQKLYVTFGAGPEWGKLVSNNNRGADKTPHSAGQSLSVKVPQKYRNEVEFIEALFVLDKQYKDHLDYDLFPATVGNEVWWLADDGYNSNSFIAGLLKASGVKPIPTPPVSVPGFNKPVPSKYFGVTQ
ncbi:MAG: hypothetical protein MI864_14885 [Pseudomonadales bacterium]|uniref:Uncharacterized protein n=1 Tax=Oleiphilus messinensis TaxID=141451 RepID=A0A1Y0IH82_9GAMM|nr:hypothetical protein [Oleiphilus messinensis]ARU58895.1 hypothetical protein OLMES_4907 [Oleiphilus messinensis]MCG8611811.1 hypothetical protein [Pseudomonadales bacterium]